MGKKCLKCGYERQPSDTAPDYECPRCGAVYAKVEALRQKGQSGARVSEKMVKRPENRFLRVFKRYPKISGCIALLCLLVCAGIVAEYYMESSFEKKSRDFHDSLSMADKEEFEQSLGNLMSLLETVHKRVSRYHLTADTISDHVMGAMDGTQEFIRLMRETAGGKSSVYGYDVNRTAETLYKDLNIIFSRVKDKRVRAIISQRLAVLLLRGIKIERNMANAEHAEIVYPKSIADKGSEREKRDERGIAEYKLALGALRSQCEKGNTNACEALRDMEQRGNPAKSSFSTELRIWQDWARRARERARNINDDFESSASFQSWNGEMLEITRDNVAEVIESQRPREPQ